MSLCRWSSMDWQCDLYVYESEAGFCVHVAGNRIDAVVPPIDFSSDEAFAASYLTQAGVIDNAPRVNIGGPHDGQSFYDLDHDELIETLTMLKREGYRFPDDLLDEGAT